MDKNFFLGLDCGTSSVGWAVTNDEYDILKAKGKALWGIRLFEEATPAADRRTFRAARRRNFRKRARLDLLNEFFEEEIKKVDPKFFERLFDSKYQIEDKTNIGDKNTLFNDKKFNDIDFHKKYPTIFHLRAELIHNKTPHDIRLVYLAIHHIIKNRGHFIYEGQQIDNVQNVDNLFKNFQQIYNDVNEGVEINYPDGFDYIKRLLTDKTLRNRAKELKTQITVTSTDDKISTKIQAEIVKALNGNKVNILKLLPYSNIEEEELEVKDFSFSSSTYDENEITIKNSIGIDDFNIISCLKEIYDWSLLDTILHGYKFISDAKITTYETHKKQLAQLKKLVKQYNPDKYDEAFFTIKDKLQNYCTYVGHGLEKGKKDKGEIKSKCTQEDVNKYFKKILEEAYKNNPDDKDLQEIYSKIELNLLLPKAINGDNRVIPYQVNLMELEAILENASNYLSFINIKDEEGFSIKEKIVSIMKFRIPYYVGPLVENTKENKEYQKFSWMVRKESSTGKILPWKFTDQVDLAACGNEFIKRMSRKCSYLPNENVLPKSSLLNCEFTLLNELNNLKINGEKPSTELKQQIYKLFEQNKSVTINKIKKYLISIGEYSKKEEIIFTGIDISFKSSLKSYIDFKDLLNSKILSYDAVEEIIEWSTVFSEGQGLLKKKIEEKYGSKINNEQLKYILSKAKSYSGWGNLSKKLLTEMYHIDEDGECKSIITLLRETSNNLMELLSNRYTISQSIELELKNTAKDYNSWSYENLVEPLLVSPSVKRSIWQTILIVKELRKVLGKDPKKIFIEMARGPEKRDKDGKGIRTVSRKSQLIKQYEELTENPEAAKILQLLEKESDATLRKDKLYLYFTQRGRCMYSNKIIDLYDLLNTNKYDIDHIYPQKSVKDDSLNNKVLVLKEENGKKSDKYPLPLDIQNKCKEHWNYLNNSGLITKEKYNRLVRKTKLDKDELENFIARQLVETRQSTKAVAKLLEKLCPDSTIVFSKAKAVSDFKRQFAFYKARSVNDLHHAKDAYLNIVVGNAYNTKFTKDPRYILRNENSDSYNLSKLFYFDISRYNHKAWERDLNGKKRRENNNDFDSYPETGTIVTVRKTLDKNNILFTRQTFQRKGKLSDLLIVKKGSKNSVLPIKSSDEKLLQVEKYGGYNNVAKAYFFLAEYTNKKKRVIRFFDVPIYKAVQIDNNKITLEEYCINELKIENPKIIIPKILINTKIKLKGFTYEISGAMGPQIGLKTAIPLLLSNDNYKYVFYLEKYNEKMKIFIRFNKNVSTGDLKNQSFLLEEKFKITKEKNINLYNELKDKLNNSIMKNRATVSSLIGNINGNVDLFSESTIKEQSFLLEQFIMLFACKFGSCDLSLIKNSKQSGNPGMGRNLNNDITFIYQSATGLYERKERISIL